jgi:hypothetical protein
MPRALVLSFAVSLAACGVPPDTDDAVGRIDLALVGHDGDGATYRLREATITVAGAGATFVFRTEDAPDRTAISQELAAGTYRVDLAGSWRLERLAADGSATPVSATLVSANPQSVAVGADTLARATLRFAVPGGDIELGRGELEVDLGVEVTPEPSVLRVVTDRDALGLLERDTGALVGVRLAAAPTGDVVVTATSADPSRITLDPAAVVFTPATWSQPRYLRIDSFADPDLEDDTVEVAFTAPGAAAAQVAITIVDIDVQWIAVGDLPWLIDAGDHVPLRVGLVHRPSAPVTLSLTSSDPALRVSPSTVVITPASWPAHQEVTLEVPVDVPAEGQVVTVLIEGADTAVTVSVHVRDLPAATLGWTGPFASVEALPPGQVSTYRLTVTEPIEVRSMQLHAASAGPLRVGVYESAEAWPAPDHLLLQSDVVTATSPDQATTIAVAPVDGARRLLQPGTYWLAVWSADDAVAATSGATAIRCRATVTGDALPSRLFSSLSSCGTAAPVGIAIVGVRP